ncbi:glycoside hydrolase family 26 protein [Gillisia sp. M10.2A]|uniref:Glycoside hydrolase family 26 protein n=1 Tax=Gillisia lutea TaxID=2909668 RepID=A0ABS9EFZ7_9FLAO|nr:glycosyl hydrolase [Gillisia lutea]MCF4101182.1 glycoside hydrolase family 26 protein [Gillisia lutea]
MKKITFLSVLMSLSLLIGCSKDEEGFNPETPPKEETPTETPEETPQGFILQPEEARSYMVDAAATDETVALFYNLKTLSDSHFVVGQQDAFSAFYNDIAGDSDMKKTTGSDPGMLGSDFMFITDDQNDGSSNNWFYQQESGIRNNAIKAYNNGMLNIFCWHFREPFEGNSFYTSEMTEFQKGNAFKSILPGGENHEYYKEKLQKVAEIAKGLIGQDGSLSPLIFRPFHEFDKDFFWWGAPYSTPEEFKTVWRFTVEYLRDELNVHNILYAFSPDNSYTTEAGYLERYPGDEYVDIVGMDNYGDLASQDGARLNLANQKLKVVSDIAIEKVKIAALSETGYFVTPSSSTLPPNFYSKNLYNVLTDSDVQVGFMMFWQNYSDSYTVPTPGMPGESDFLNFVEKEETYLLNDMPSMYSIQ